MKKADLHIRVDHDLGDWTKETAKNDSRSVTSYVTMLLRREREKLEREGK